jgi:DHA1 family bicyclomycin/chloramphenicol resistance-like MFS transporter
MSRRVATSTVVVLGLLSTFGPISLDLYLPSLPQLADELHTSASAAQLTITFCLLGLAVGQLVAGPLSDRYGRRRPLIVGLALYLLTSLACAFAPTIEVLLLLRLLQGLAGAAGLVIARAVARDLYSGRALVVFFARLTLVSGLAPVLAPVAGGQLARFTDWRGIFAVLAAFGVVLLVAGIVGVPETLPPDRRLDRGIRDTMRGFGGLVRDRLFVGTALTSGLASASMFAYIAGATFVLQRIYGLSAQGFSFVFGANSIGIMVMSQVGARLVRRHPPERILSVGLAGNITGSTGLAVTAIGGLGLPWLVGSLFVMVASLGMVFPNAMAIALAEHGAQAGTASSVLGLLQYVVGALVAPMVGIAGEDTAVPLGVVAFCASASAVLVFVLMVRHRVPVELHERVSAG